jgi:hypothetical protein
MRFDRRSTFCIVLHVHTLESTKIVILAKKKKEQGENGKERRGKENSETGCPISIYHHRIGEHITSGSQMAKKDVHFPVTGEKRGLIS